jgi:hypothetical protein
MHCFMSDVFLHVLKIYVYVFKMYVHVCAYVHVFFAA